MILCTKYKICTYVNMINMCSVKVPPVPGTFDIIGETLAGLADDTP